MGTLTDSINQDLGELTEKAIVSLNRASEDLVAWCDMVRDPEMPWAFRWAKESTRAANVAAGNYILESHRQADRGISSYLDSCIPTWLKYDMDPKLPQGDAFGWGIFGYGINICVDILGIADQCAWTGKWRQREEYDTRVYVEVGRELAGSLGTC